MENYYNEIEIGKRVRQKRLELKYTREQLSFIANISDKFLYDIEVGNKGMSAETLLKISKALKISTDWLLKGGIPPALHNFTQS